jgi:dihydroorotase
MKKLTITRPDDWHVHVRDGAMLTTTVADIARYFGRAIIMPNLKPPITNCDEANAYRERIMAHVPAGSAFDPLMVLYLTAKTRPEEIAKAAASRHVKAVKFYPAGATTNSDAGVSGLEQSFDTLAAMEEHGIPFLIHGEVTDHHIDIFDREKVFIDRTLMPLVERFPKLKMVVEHITTAEAAQFVSAAPANVGATITVQHLLYNRNDMLVGGIRPHLYCLPILKRGAHQEALLTAATSGNPKFFLGTDSAPHLSHTKETSCGCAGCYTAFAAIELYAHVFEKMNALDKLEAFASHFGPDFYGLARNSDSITLQKQDWQIPASIAAGQQSITPLMAGETLGWQVV